MARSGGISFELERFEWASPDRLEVEGRWHGVRRRLPRATLVVEVAGERGRPRALPDTGAVSPERWVAAFPWEGELPVLPGAELEVGRGIVVDLPRPRRSKARGVAAVAAGPTAPIQASTREERDAIPGREEAERLLAVLTASRAEADEAAARAQAAETEAASLREEATTLRDEAATLRGEATTLRGEFVPLRDQVATLREEADTLRARAEEAEVELSSLRPLWDEAAAERDTLRAKAEDVEPELQTLRAHAEQAEAELRALPDAAAERDTLRARADDAEAELQTLRA